MNLNLSHSIGLVSDHLEPDSQPFFNVTQAALQHSVTARRAAAARLAAKHQAVSAFALGGRGCGRGEAEKVKKEAGVGVLSPPRPNFQTFWEPLGKTILKETRKV